MKISKERTGNIAKRRLLVNPYRPETQIEFADFFRDRKSTPKNFCDKDFAELSGELSGVICLKALVLLGSALESFRKFFGALRAIFWFWGSFLVHDF